MDNKTIYALSTAYGRSGVAVIRVSGSQVKQIIKQITDIDIRNIKARYVYFVDLKDNVTRETIDKCLIIYFKNPQSFTGEDVLEIQCHGSKAVLNSVFKVLSSFENVRIAEPGEFSKRAFYNNKMDLTEAEGLADLIDAETSEQQKYAIRQMEGNLRSLYNSWRKDLIKVLSYIEAYIDFPEEDVSDSISNNILNTVFKVKKEIKEHINNNNVCKQLKEGFQIVVAGATNAGKSSLINALTNKKTMIVSNIAGTTRDAVDVNMDIGGYPVVITDTAGIRKTKNTIEKIGVKAALEKIKNADAVIAIYDASLGYFNNDVLPKNIKDIIYVANKVDKISSKRKAEISKNKHILISAKYNEGIDAVVSKIKEKIEKNFLSSSNYLITRERYKEALKECLESLNKFSLNKEIELAAEDIRLACRSIGIITGEVKVSEVLDNIFSSFCIGK